MELSDATIGRMHRFVDESTRILRQCKSDITYIRKHGTVIYHLDFSLLAPVFFNKTPVGAKRLFSMDKAKYIKLLGTASVSPVTISITGPTLFEFLDFLNHDFKRVSELKSRAADTAGSLQDQLKLLTSEEVIDYVRQASTHDFQPAKKLETMLEEGRLVGLGDVVHTNIQESDELRRELQALVALQFKLRSDDDRKSRTDEDRKFHYLMDSINAVITKELLGRDRVFFVTNNKAIRSYCASSGHPLVRDPWVPVFVKFLAALDSAVALEYIEDALRIYEAASNAIKSGQTHLPSFNVYSSGCTQYHQMFSGVMEDVSAETPSQTGYDSPNRLSVDKKGLEEALEKTALKLKDDANGLMRLSQKYDIGYFDLLEISDDPIYRQINRNLLD
jgi:hypothetical protein